MGVKDRSNEKMIWIAGWYVAFVWFFAISANWLLQENISPGKFGMVIFLFAIAFILICAPWWQPQTPYWQLMWPLYVLFIVCVAAWYQYGPIGEGTDFVWGDSLYYIPVFIPLFMVGGRRWADGDAEDDTPAPPPLRKLPYYISE
ncbi:MAG: hypothetical protein HY751_07200 [Nitrospinae bacterium]|nr:hypothetical protein [Nitrospinota bacterium]